jgi:DnaJ-class molecular chaperone
VRVSVETPSRLTKDEEALLRRLAELRDEEVAPPESSLISKIRSGFR